MRRLVLVFMMLLLPLQWSWAAAASVCTHESGASHLGHHEHRHAGANAAQSTGDDDAKTGQHTLNAAHPDCQVCHGVGVACLRVQALGQAVWPGNDKLPDYQRHLPDPPADAFLRPPLPLVA